MRFIHLAVVPVLLVAGAVSGAGNNGSAPDPGREYHQQVDCHNAYDRLVKTMKSGEKLSDTTVAWATAYEAGAKGGTPCPAPLPEMIAGGGNWHISTPEGRDNAGAYAAKQKDASALSEVGIAWITQSIDGGTPQDGIALMQEAARLGDPVALFTVGTLYSAGMIGGTKDHATAFGMINQAAQAGHIDAIYRTGLYYSEGIGTKKDPKKAFTAFKAAAERGHLYATIMAFDMINSGKGTKKDFNLAYRLARIVANEGEVYGAVMAASALLQLDDPKPHEDEILFWMDQGISRGDETIRSQLVPLKQRVIAAFTKAKAPPAYQPRVWKACPMKTVCTVNHYSGLQRCTTNKDYWNDCDG